MLVQRRQAAAAVRSVRAIVAAVQFGHTATAAAAFGILDRTDFRDSEVADEKRVPLSSPFRTKLSLKA